MSREAFEQYARERDGLSSDLGYVRRGDGYFGATNDLWRAWRAACAACADACERQEKSHKERATGLDMGWALKEQLDQQVACGNCAAACRELGK